MEPDYSFEEGQTSSEERESAPAAGPAPYYRGARGDTVAEQRVYAGEPRRVQQRRVSPPPSTEGLVAHFARGVARIFALLFLAAGIGLWMVYFTVMYVFGLFGGAGMAPEDVANDLMFGILSALIALVLLMWSRSEKGA